MWCYLAELLRAVPGRALVKGMLFNGCDVELYQAKMLSASPGIELETSDPLVLASSESVASERFVEFSVCWNKQLCVALHIQWLGGVGFLKRSKALCVIVLLPHHPHNAQVYPSSLAATAGLFIHLCCAHLTPPLPP